MTINGSSGLINRILDSLFPRKCLVCKETNTERLCPKCQLEKKSPSEFKPNLYFLYNYKGAIRKILHRFKFMQDKNLAKKYLKPNLKLDIYKEYDVVIPLPCHWLRVLKRKFNHMNYLFDFVPNIDRTIVKRHKYTKKFYKLTKLDRQKMIKGVFKVMKPESIKGKRILVVDDIYTTGASFNELKNTLEEHLPECVDGLFICKA